ncbi:MAG: PEP-CTERM sorting domain-containing protein [Candidatus Tectomicrobia bacterium]|uniref:PEP-CTERM sorting domain-containing protein n=1 Tax=Tectimicrobiota bacterium TaxID=2528274 RepID=A0A937VXU3_UNCTE|nr:PEP-CTERM sorting domain-containing protein [Candidatus Tectomicrobia bacterium]
METGHRIAYEGIFTPGPLLAGFDPSPSSLRISINQSDASLSQAITLNSPPLPPPPVTVVPEPGTWVLMLTGALGLLGYRWRRQHQA